MLIGLNSIKTVNREKAAVLGAWFDEETAQPTVQAAKTLFAAVEIRASLKAVCRKQTEVPSLPRHATSPVPQLQPVSTTETYTSPYQALNSILDQNSRSSRWLAQYGLLQQFYTTDCFVDMSTTQDGGMSVVLRSPAGYRRTVVCRADGTVAQRVTGPHGEEIVRFNSDNNPIFSHANKAEAVLAIA